MCYTYKGIFEKRKREKKSFGTLPKGNNKDFKTKMKLYKFALFDQA